MGVIQVGAQVSQMGDEQGLNGENESESLRKKQKCLQEMERLVGRN